MTKPVIDVFVYGTLKPGERNYSLCAEYVKQSQPAIAFGQLYSLSFGYPALVPGSNLIQGFVLSFDDPHVLTVLDEYEQHNPDVLRQYSPELLSQQNEYDRRQIKTYAQTHDFLGLAWAYVMTTEQVQRLGGVLVPNGCWSSS